MDEEYKGFRYYNRMLSWYSMFIELLDKTITHIEGGRYD